jgi:hypothetical protein
MFRNIVGNFGTSDTPIVRVHVPISVKCCFISEDKVIQIIMVVVHILQHETGILLTCCLIFLQKLLAHIEVCTHEVLNVCATHRDQWIEGC